MNGAGRVCLGQRHTVSMDMRGCINKANVVRSARQDSRNAKTDSAVSTIRLDCTHRPQGDPKSKPPPNYKKNRIKSH